MSSKVINVGAGYYNSYLILGEKNVLIDTVPEILSDILINNIIFPILLIITIIYYIFLSVHCSKATSISLEKSLHLPLSL